ncbi:MAG: hypothetical protein KJ061_03115 [Vicinamibacteraceae bacterium]|nr:hypothetical protein [Vicinamibacteraceae bacterium]
MDDTLERLARELADAIASAAGSDARVQACRTHAREMGYDLKLSLEATIGFAPKIAAGPRTSDDGQDPPRPLELTGTDRRFLRSLRIACDDVAGVP